MKFIDYVELATIPVGLIFYGFYLISTHESMKDLAGIILTITGFTGFIIALSVKYFLRKHKWAKTWWFNLTAGFLSCIFVFILFIIYARINN